jgi:hypothetical protein
VKRLLLVAAAGAAALLGGLWLRAAGPAPAAPGPPVAPVSTTVPSPPALAALPVPARDVFRYADQPAPLRVEAPPLVMTAPPIEPPPPLAPPAPEPVRLVGLVRRGGAWRAALSIHDDVVVLGIGESSGGYELLAVDEAEGVTVRDPQGQERRLPVPEP